MENRDCVCRFTCSKLQFLFAGLEYGDVDLSLTETQLQSSEVVGKAREHQQPRVVPGAELELDEHPGLPEEPGHLQVVVGPGERHGLQQNVATMVMHLFLMGNKRENRHKNNN